ncbi:hypothetical protein DL546_005039 [Coniochaeta pulveracea]|uniref:Uncharacterized protein n=1 Tax=Coniochaeta pulveracea TaxID=177199 RepID=A0A420Y641_9PEZI|nr:hypothetical protein DL546_005039 [Coniochaeta pulveracea]
MASFNRADVDAAEQALINGLVKAIRSLTPVVHADTIHSGGIKLTMAARDRASVLCAMSVDSDGSSNTARYVAPVLSAEPFRPDLHNFVVTSCDRTYVLATKLPSTDNLSSTVLVVAHVNSAEAMPDATSSSACSHQGMHLDIATVISDTPVNFTSLGLLSNIPETPPKHAAWCYAFVQVAEGMAIRYLGMACRGSPLTVCGPVFASRLLTWRRQGIQELRGKLTLDTPVLDDRLPAINAISDNPRVPAPGFLAGQMPFAVEPLVDMFPPRTFRYHALVQITHLGVLQSTFGARVILLALVDFLAPVHIHSSFAPMAAHDLAHVVVAVLPAGGT